MTTRGFYTTQAAAGTTQATAAALAADNVMVTTVTQGSAECVILPALNLGDWQFVTNGQSTNNLYIYPQVGGKINNATANAYVELPPNRSAQFQAIDALNVLAFF